MESIIYEKKSKFIGKIYSMDSIDAINTKLSSISKIYSDSSHICYAYRIITYENKVLEKFFDAKEPKRSSGFSILNYLAIKQIFNILAVSIRYYGGVKLGKSLLKNTYIRSISKIISENEIIEKELIYCFSFNIFYNDLKNIRLLSNIKFIKKIEKKFILNKIKIIIYSYLGDKEKILKYIKNVGITNPKLYYEGNVYI